MCVPVKEFICVRSQSVYSFGYYAKRLFLCYTISFLLWSISLHEASVGFSIIRYGLF